MEAAIKAESVVCLWTFASKVDSSAHLHANNFASFVVFKSYLKCVFTLLHSATELAVWVKTESGRDARCLR